MRIVKLMTVVWTLFSILVAYGLGSIPFGLLLNLYAGEGDIRTQGSKNIGATNVLRTGRKDLAILTLLLDSVKGILPLLIFSTSPLLLISAAVVGHVFPVWLGFKGGKGVATALGCLLYAYPIVGLGILVMWGGIFWQSRISSVASLLSFGTAPLWACFYHSWTLALFLLGIWLFLAWTHRQNIKRLWNGTEAVMKRKNKNNTPGENS